MKALGVLFIIFGIILLIAGMVCLFASASPYLVGGGIVGSVLLNAVGATLLTSRKK